MFGDMDCYELASCDSCLELEIKLEIELQLQDMELISKEDSASLKEDLENLTEKINDIEYNHDQYALKTDLTDVSQLSYDKTSNHEDGCLGNTWTVLKVLSRI